MKTNKIFENRFCIFVKPKGKKKAHFHRTWDNVGWWNDLHEVEDEVNHIYTGEDEITIRQSWHTEKGYTGQDVIRTFPAK